MQGRVPVTQSLLLKCNIYIMCTYIDCLQVSGNEISAFMLKTCENAAEVTLTLTITRNFGSCSRTTSGKMVRSAKTRNIIFCLCKPPLQVTKYRMSLSCLHMMIIGVM
jgi:hypothetical protein